jgi:glycosyltransferase involved in cell wall biosynthesis
MLKRTHPDLIHAHYPFLMGHTALRLAHAFEAPLVYTHHVRFEEYTHYLPLDSPMTERFMAKLSTAYANLCEQVIAPSDSVAALLRAWGMQRPIAVVPTGVEISRFAHGNGVAARRAFGIPRDAFLVGHIGRLAPEKNLVFLAQALAQFLQVHPKAHAFIAGRGPCAEEMRQVFDRAGVHGRLHMAGILSRQELVDCYHAMDVFAFASNTETQGIVLVEAMAAGVPVIALDASGVREVVQDGDNGRLLSSSARVEDYVKALQWAAAATPRARHDLRKAAHETAKEFSLSKCAHRALALYRAVIARGRMARAARDSAWAHAMRRMRTEWQLLRNVTQATGAALTRSKKSLATAKG